MAKPGRGGAATELLRAGHCPVLAVPMRLVGRYGLDNSVAHGMAKNQQLQRRGADPVLIDGTEVARLCNAWMITAGTSPWISTLPELRRDRPCRTYESGKAGIELWAARHRERLAREVGMRRMRRAG